MKLEQLEKLATVLQAETEPELPEAPFSFDFRAYQNGYYLCQYCRRAFKTISNKRAHQGWCLKKGAEA